MNRKMKKITAILLAGSFALTACSGTQTQSDTSTAGAPGTSGPESSVLRIATFEAPATLGMAQSDGAGSMAMLNVSDPLVRLADDGSLEPALAVSWEEIDDVTWQFKLREGVKFSNGEDFNADAVVYNYNKLETPELTYRWASHWGDAWPVKVEKVDDYTVNFICSSHSTLIPGVTSRIMLYAPGQWEEEGDTTYLTHPAGVGPYKVVSWKEGISLELTAFDGYWGGKPEIDTIIFDVVTNPDSRVAALQAGEYDVVLSIPYEQISNLESVADGKFTIETFDTVSINYMYFNGYASKDRWVWNQTFREAVCHAIDQEGIAAGLLGGHCTVMNGPANPLTTGGDTDTKAYTYDPELSKKLLAECGYDGTELLFELEGGEFSNDIDIAEFIVSQLQAVGINVVLKQVEAAILDNDRKVEGIVDFCMTNTPGPFYGDSVYYWSQFASKRGFKGEQFEDVAAMFASAEVSGISAEERAKILKQANELLWTKCPVLFSVTNPEVYGISTKVHGIGCTPNGWLNLRNASID